MYLNPCSMSHHYYSQVCKCHTAVHCSCFLLYAGRAGHTVRNCALQHEQQRSCHHVGLCHMAAAQQQQQLHTCLHSSVSGKLVISLQYLVSTSQFPVPAQQGGVTHTAHLAISINEHLAVLVLCEFPVARKQAPKVCVWNGYQGSQ